MRFLYLLAVTALTAMPAVAHTSGPGWAAATLSDGLESYRSGNFGAARAAFRALADHDSAIGETMLGVIYARGQGVGADPATAAIFYMRAADRGYAPAQLAFAEALASGQGIGRDGAAACLWARLAQQRGDARLAKAAAALADRLEVTLTPGEREKLDRRLTGWRPWATGRP